MTHLHTTKARRDFVCSQLKVANPRQVKTIYLDTEKVTHFHEMERKRK